MEYKYWQTNCLLKHNEQQRVSQLLIGGIQWNWEFLYCTFKCLGYNPKLLQIYERNTMNSWVLVAHVCNPSYLGGSDQEDQGSKPAQANSSIRPYLKNTHYKKGLVQWPKV
jgi:hypothetical protein